MSGLIVPANLWSTWHSKVMGSEPQAVMLPVMLPVSDPTLLVACARKPTRRFVT